MSGQYRIGDVAKLFDIPMQNLRFYEEKGILSPEKNKENGYRSYTAWNTNDLLDALRYRELDFSLEQITNILNNSSMEEICEFYAGQEKKILEQIEKYKIALESLSMERNRIQHAGKFIGKLEKCKRPAFLLQRFRKRDIYQDMLENEDLKNLHDELVPWLKARPQPLASFYVPLDSLMCDENFEEIEYWYGFSVTMDEGLKNGITIEIPTEYIAPCPAIYTVFIAGEEGTFMESFYNQVYKKIREDGHIVNGCPFGRLIVKSHEKKQYLRYFEVWVPVVS